MLRVSILLWISSRFFSTSAFTFPEVKLEAFEPEGFKVSIPETENVKLFAFHGNRNRAISQIEPGEFSEDIINPEVNGWFYFNPTLKLKVGDKIHYWMFIQHGDLGYRKFDQVWEVTELLPLKTLQENASCLESASKILGLWKVCKNEIIFNETFSEDYVDELKWKRAHFIPTEPDFEFCSYQRRNDTCNVKKSILTIKPIALTETADVHGVLDLRNGCSSHLESDCIMYQDSGFILPPVVSAKIKTIRNFKYGTVEIKAKLPKGNWIYPEIYLESASERKRIWLAYSRGNEHLTGNGGDDIGGTVLFGGPVLNTTEPERSKHLSSTRASKPYSDDYHVYSVVWKPSKISLLVDGVQYGSSGNTLASQFNGYMHLCMGVGVGGVSDFPDDYISTNNVKKPWKNYERLQTKKFFNSRNEWLPSWTEDSSLKVEYVKIKAL